MKDKLESARLELKKVSFAELADAGFIAKARKGYVCPNCANGSGSDGTGAIVKQGSDGEQLLCGKCQDGFDVIDILGIFWNLDPNDKKDFVEILMRGCNRFNIHFDDDGNAVSVRSPLTQKKISPEEIQRRRDRIKNTISAAQKNLPALLKKHGGLWRGLDQSTLQDFFIGFDKAWYAREGAPLTPRVIIPTSFNHYLARLDANISDFNIPDGVLLEEKEHRGEKEIFNFKRALLDSSNPLCLVVEGEIDAMSIAQVTRQLDSNNKAQYPVNVIAIGGTNPSSAILAQFKSLKPKNFIVLFDNDKAGHDAAPIFAAKLRAFGHNVVVENLSNSHSDPNDFLLADSNALKLRIEEIISSVSFSGSSLNSAPLDPDSEKLLASWQDINGDINPDTLQNLKNAKALLDSFSADNISSEKVQFAQTKRAVALCQFYDCFISSADRFFAILENSKKSAANEIKKLQLLGNSVPEHFLALSQVSIRNLKAEVAKFFTKIQKAHKEWREAEDVRLAIARNKKRREERQAQLLLDADQLRSLQLAPPSPERDADIIALIKSMCKWNFDKHGNPVSIKADGANLNLILDNDPYLSQLFGFDEFKAEPVFLKQAPWHKAPPVNPQWTDIDDSQLRVYLRDNYAELANKELVFDYFTKFAMKNSFHALKDYFKNLPQWDGTPRAESLFINFLGVDDTPFARAVTLNWLTAAIARIFHPGCEYQTALVLHGAQGIGKSFTLKRLGGKYCKAITDRVDDPHAADTIKLVWIGEFKEMAGMRKAEINAIKQFIELSEDTRRFAYDRRPSSVPRHCVFAITVNDEKFLSDKTGNRRYLILHCNNKQGNYVKGLTDEFISQLWAEVFAHYNELFKDGFDESKLELSKDFRAQAEDITKQHVNDDGLEGEIQAFADVKIPVPAIWDLCSREERRKFFIDGKIEFVEDDLEARFQNRAGKKYQSLLPQFTAACKTEDGSVRKTYHKAPNGMECWHVTFYGSELRQHLCAAEIYNECFGNDRRKSMSAIHDILSRLAGWYKSNERIRDYAAYGDQKTIYRRVSSATDDNGNDNDLSNKNFSSTVNNNSFAASNSHDSAEQIQSDFDIPDFDIPDFD